MYHKPTPTAQLPPPAKVLAKFKECPAGCYPNLVIYSAEGAQVIKPGNAFGRCIRCLTYWEVTPKGEVVNIRWGADVPPEKPRVNIVISGAAYPPLLGRDPGDGHAG